MSASISAFIQDLRDMDLIGPHIAYEKVFDPSPPVHRTVQAPWSKEISTLLSGMGISSLYSHQVQAIDLIRSGQNAVVATPTASGKSLIYTLPVLERIQNNPHSRSLFLFPLKALAQDQLRAFRDLASAWPGGQRPTAAVYDGDTAKSDRTRIRKSPPNVLLTNPEMLHLSLLPYQQQWAGLWANLDFVVIDEVHTYRGIMGTNMAWVFRRLRRICAAHGANPTFVFCSATIGNPGQLTRDLTGTGVEVVESNGAPQGARHFLFVNPLHGAAKSALHVLQQSLSRGLKTIVYTQSRKMTELIAVWAKQRCPEVAQRISAYRSGFLPSERREIEKKLSQGRNLAVISTSALELGIDIGGLDVCILVGYPGSVMATWQRGGRVGRQQQDSAVVLIGHEDNLDQYFMTHPERFFSQQPEDAVVNPTNPVIMPTHLQCAAVDAPLEYKEPLLTEPGVQEAVAALQRQGLLRPSQDGGRLFPSQPGVVMEVNLRGSGKPLTILNQAQGKAIGSIDHFRACQETHPGAIYLHQGQTYHIDDLQLSNGLVVASPARVSYFTRVRTEKETEILTQSRTATVGQARVGFGRLRVTMHITGYEKRLIKGHKLLDVVPLDMDPFIFETDGLWLQIPDWMRNRVEDARLHFMGGIHALEHAMIGLMPLLILADRNDLGGIAQPEQPQLQGAAVFVFDGIPGGVGLTGQAFGKVQRLLEQTLEALQDCTCETGCPGCVHSPKCGSGNRPLDKEAALGVLRLVLDGGGAQIVPRRQLSEPTPGERDHGPAASGPSVHYAVLDLETQRSAQEVGGWDQARHMGISLAVLYDSQKDAYLSFSESEVSKLVEHLQQVDLVVGFNILRFDYPVLSGYTSVPLQRLPTLDLLSSIYSRLGYRLSLDHVVSATLGVHKNGNGLLALRWWQEGNLEKIQAYCQEDVALTLGLYLHGRDHGYIQFRNKAGKLVELLVNWSSPPQQKQQQQGNNR